MNVEIRRIGEMMPIQTLETNCLEDLMAVINNLGKVSASITLAAKNKLEITIADNNYCWMPVPAAEY
jgi:hypothetical protein